MCGDFEEDSHPRRDEIVAILEAGSATLLPLSQALTADVHFVVSQASGASSDAKLKQLEKSGVCFVSPAFVVEWMAHPWQIPSKVCVFDGLSHIKC